MLVTQRVDPIPERGERRDALDQRWIHLLLDCGLLPIAVPNSARVAESLLAELEPVGVLLTGGNDLRDLGGDTPERDETEGVLLDACLHRRLPLLGVCRGMQAIQHRFGVPLHAVDGHVASSQTILWRGERISVNSYHRYGTTSTVAGLRVEGRADDGVVKGVRHETAPMVGIMWHPERIAPFASRDRALLTSMFGE